MMELRANQSHWTHNQITSQFHHPGCTVAGPRYMSEALHSWKSVDLMGLQLRDCIACPLAPCNQSQPRNNNNASTNGLYLRTTNQQPTPACLSCRMENEAGHFSVL